MAGHPYIELRQHMDLSSLPLIHSYSGQQMDSILGALPATVQAMRGNCSDAEPLPDALATAVAGLQPPLLPVAPGQCLLLTDATVASTWHLLWLDNVAIRHSPSKRLHVAAPLLGGAGGAAPGPAALYLTRSTLQGAGGATPSSERGGSAAAADAASAAAPDSGAAPGNGTVGVEVQDMLYAEGCTFANLGGDQPAAVLAAQPDTTAAFTACTFQNNHFAARPAGALGAATPAAAVRASAAPAALRFERCVFINNTAEVVSTDAGGAEVEVADVAAVGSVRVFTDLRGSNSAAAGETDGQQGLQLEPLPASAEVKFLSGADSWLREQQAAFPDAAAWAPPEPALPVVAPPPPRRLATEIGSGAIALFSVFSAAAVICAALMVFWCWWRIKREPPYTDQLPTIPVSPVKPPRQVSRAHTTPMRHCRAADINPVFSPDPPNAAPGNVEANPPLNKFASFPQSSNAPRLAHSNPFFDFAMHSSDSSPTAPGSHASSAASASLLHAFRKAAPPPPESLLRRQLGAAEALRRRPVPLSPDATLDAASAAAAAEAAASAAVGRPLSPPRLPPAGATIPQRMEFLQQQLDSIAGQSVLGGLVLQQGRGKRLQGGQAVIQFAKDSATEQPWAIKFFVCGRGFKDEAALYRDVDSPLGPFLPLVRNIIGDTDVGTGGGTWDRPAAVTADAGRIADALGRPLPPCIVMERGESLDIWRMRNAHDGIDVFTALQIVNHIAERLAALHGAGYVHRDLKPSNVMWLPRRNRWTLIDFGSAARTGAAAPLSFSPAYAAPEVARAHLAGRGTLAADPKVDAWALGVVAIEIFCNRMPLDLMEGADTVLRRIAGELPLPWEDLQAGAHIVRALGRYRGTVLSLVNRDPARRSTVTEFIRASRDIVSRVSLTVSRAGSAPVLDCPGPSLGPGTPAASTLGSSPQDTALSAETAAG